MRCYDFFAVIDRQYAEETRVRRVIPCHCGAAPSGVAGVIDERWTRFYCRSGVLQPDHTVRWDREPFETGATNELYHSNVACSACIRAAEDAAGTPTGLSGGDALDEPTITVTRLPEQWSCACVSCGLEVPFGFSRPNRGGAIWPVTGEDFDPARAPYPEARFGDVWRHRDWLFSMGASTEW